MTPPSALRAPHTQRATLWAGAARRGEEAQAGPSSDWLMCKTWTLVEEVQGDVANSVL